MPALFKSTTHYVKGRSNFPKAEKGSLSPAGCLAGGELPFPLWCISGLAKGKRAALVEGEFCRHKNQDRIPAISTKRVSGKGNWEKSPPESLKRRCCLA